MQLASPLVQAVLVARPLLTYVVMGERRLANSVGNAQEPVPRASGSVPRLNYSACQPDQQAEIGRRIMHAQWRHWLDYDPVALAVLVIGIGLVELLAFSV